MEKKTGTEMAKEMSGFVNNMCFDPKEFIEEMNRSHRTLQQTFGTLVFAWIADQAKKQPGQYDLRNEATVELCKEIVKQVDDFDCKRHLPFI